MPSQGRSPETSGSLKEELLGRIGELLERNRLNIPPKGLLLAVSGGVDSMVMMELLHRMDIAGGVAHFDHGLRGEEGEKDRELVERESRSRGLPFHGVQLHPPQSTPEKGLQHWAREERYRWLYHFLEQEGYQFIATAHQADDRLETVLMGILRGSGFRGVMGVPTQKDRVIRPMNRIWKERIEQYAKEQAIPYREDPSNRSDRYLRNRIRRELLPPFKEAFPEQRGALLRSLDLLEEGGTFLQEMGDREREKSLLYDPEREEYRIPKKALLESRAPRVLFFELLRPFGIPPSSIAPLWEKLEGEAGARVDGPEWSLVRDRDAFILFRPDKRDEASEIWSIPSPDKSGNAPLELEMVDPREAPFPTDDPYEAYLSLEGSSFPLTLRPVRQGDRFTPLGMKEGSKPVLEHLTDRKWPLHYKEKAKVLSDAEGKLLWVIGGAIDEHCRIKKGSRRALWVRYLAEKE